MYPSSPPRHVSSFAVIFAPRSYAAVTFMAGAGPERSRAGRGGGFPGPVGPPGVSLPDPDGDLWRARARRAIAAGRELPPGTSRGERRPPPVPVRGRRAAREEEPGGATRRALVVALTLASCPTRATDRPTGGGVASARPPRSPAAAGPAAGPGRAARRGRGAQVRARAGSPRSQAPAFVLALGGDLDQFSSNEISPRPAGRRRRPLPPRPRARPSRSIAGPASDGGPPRSPAAPSTPTCGPRCAPRARASRSSTTPGPAPRRRARSRSRASSASAAAGPTPLPSRGRPRRRRWSTGTSAPSSGRTGPCRCWSSGPSGRRRAR